MPLSLLGGDRGEVLCRMRIKKSRSKQRSGGGGEMDRTRLLVGATNDEENGGSCGSHGWMERVGVGVVERVKIT